jgi:polysaccharide biosynthesis transport protein
VQVVMSRDLAREAIKQLGLVGNEEFDPLAGEMGCCGA